MAYEIFGKDMTELYSEPSSQAPDVKKEERIINDRLEGRNSVLEAIKAGRTIDKLYIQDGLRDSTIQKILNKVKGTGTAINFVKKQRLDSMSETGHHQGVIAQTTSYEYAELEDIFELAAKRKEPPFIILLDEIEDPHNLGAIIRTANICGAHGVIIPKHRASGLTATVVRASAGAINFTPVVKVTNIARTIDELKARGLWFACADMDGEVMYKCNLTGSIGLVIGNEGSGVSRLVKEKCDYIVSIPMHGDIDSLNASVATGILAYEIVRQRYS
jgi:23S rRNA (guanosine2251-2'-O)-methyltransferase